MRRRNTEKRVREKDRERQRDREKEKQNVIQKHLLRQRKERNKDKCKPE